MALDVYHKVLHKLFEATGGRDSKAVDLKDLVKKLGFHGNYTDIFERMSRDNWIIETAKADFVWLTQWGAAEAKKSLGTPVTSDGGNDTDLKREASRAAATVKELAALIDNFAARADKNDFPPIERKFAELQNTINQIKKNLA